MSAIVRHEGGHDQINVASELPAIFQLASALAKASGFLPQHIRNEGEIVAVVLAGRELGLAPMASIRSIKLIKGNVTLDASIQLALIVRSGCRFEWLDDGHNGVARLQLERPGQAPYVSRFSIDDAKLAGLTTGDTWRKHPAAMLRARCVTAAGKAYCPDVLAGVYLPDELPDTAVRGMAVTDVTGVDVADVSEPFDASSHVVDAQPTVDSNIDRYVNELPLIDSRELLVDWASEMLALAGPVKGNAPWKAFAARCEALKLAPREIVEAAQKVAA